MEQESNQEGMREMFFKETIRENIAPILETLFVEEVDFDTYMDAIAGYLDSAVPDLPKDFEKKYGPEIGDKENFLEQFRSALIDFIKQKDHVKLTPKNRKILAKFITELTDFEFEISYEV